MLGKTGAASKKFAAATKFCHMIKMLFSHRLYIKLERRYHPSALLGLILTLKLVVWADMTTASK